MITTAELKMNDMQLAYLFKDLLEGLKKVGGEYPVFLPEYVEFHSDIDFIFKTPVSTTKEIKDALYFLAVTAYHMATGESELNCESILIDGYSDIESEFWPLIKFLLSRKEIAFNRLEKIVAKAVADNTPTEEETEEENVLDENNTEVTAGNQVVVEYNPGDKVRIKEDAKGIPGFPFVKGMEQWRGRVVTIVLGLGGGSGYYNIEEGQGFGWSSEWFEPVEKPVAKNTNKKNVGRDAETFLDEVFDWIGENMELSSRSDWDWSFSAGNFLLIKMHLNSDDTSGIKTVGFIDVEKEVDDTLVYVLRRGVDELKQKLRGKKVVSLRSSSNGNWYLQVVESVEKPVTQEKGKNLVGRDAETFLDEISDWTKEQNSWNFTDLWTWGFNSEKTLVDFSLISYNSVSVLKEAGFIDSVEEIAHCQVCVSKRGFDKLKKELKGKRVISLMNSKDEGNQRNWCLKIVEPNASSEQAEQLVSVTQEPREFKSGDKIKMKEDCKGSQKGKVYELAFGNTRGVRRENLYARKGPLKMGKVGCGCHDKWELVEAVGYPGVKIYKPGDKARIKRDGLAESAPPDMNSWFGKIVTIDSSLSSDRTYLIKEDNFPWSSEWFEPVELAGEYQIILKNLRSSFTRQLNTLIKKGYHEAAGLSKKDFRTEVGKLRELLPALAQEIEANPIEEGHFTFLIVVDREFVSLGDQISRLELDGKVGKSDLGDEELNKVCNIESVHVPLGGAYLVIDIEDGGNVLDKSSHDATLLIEAIGRSPLVMEEGLALLTHYPYILHCHGMDFSGSFDESGNVPNASIRMGVKPTINSNDPGLVTPICGTPSCKKRIGV